MLKQAKFHYPHPLRQTHHVPAAAVSEPLTPALKTLLNLATCYGRAVEPTHHLVKLIGA